MLEDHTPTTGQADPSAGRARRWLLGALIVGLVALSSITSVDRYAEREYEALFQRAFITFALARTLNGLISAVQGTELALQPAGVGVTLTPGEVLDPVNDLIERFSWIMLGATISLGVQQVLLDVGQWWGLRLLVALLGLVWLWLRVRRAEEGPGPGSFERSVLRVLVLVLFIRFAVPVAMIANEALYQLFLEERYVESAQVVETAGADLERVEAAARTAAEAPAREHQDDTDTSIFDAIGRTLDSTRQSLDFNRRLAAFKARAAEVIEHLIQLAVVFVLQTGLLPIAFLWLFLQLFRRLFHKFD